MKNNSLDNILWNIEISYNKQNIVFYCISQLACLRNARHLLKCFVILNYEMPADIYAFTQNRESGDGCNTFWISFSFSETICIRKQNFNTIKPYQSANHPHCCNTFTYDYIHTIYTWIDKIKCCNWHHKRGRLQQSTGQLQHSLKSFLNII